MIKCPLQGMSSNAVITFHSRLWNSTFIEVTEQKGRKRKQKIEFPPEGEGTRRLFSLSTQDYSKLHHVVVTVKASLKVDSSRNTVLHNAETQVSPQHLGCSDVKLLIVLRLCSTG